MEARRYISLDPGATREAASRIAGALTSGCVIALSGPLGAGKTEFAKGFASGLGIRENVVSPTFTLEAAYEVPAAASSVLRVLHHWDMYRLGPDSGENEVVEYASSPGDVVLVEWPEKTPWLEPLIGVRIVLGYLDAGQEAGLGAGVPAEDVRTMEISGPGSAEILARAQLGTVEGLILPGEISSGERIR